MQQNQGYIQEIEAPIASYPNRKFILQKSIGQGAQGSVFFVKSKNWGNYDQNDFALKYSFLNSVGDGEIKFIELIIQYQNSQNEVTYPCNMIRVFDNFIYNNQYYITIMEKGDIDLYSFLNQNRDKLSYEEKQQICIDITRPICFLHKKNLVHRDVKPENYIKVGNVFKLIDFGCVRKSTFTRLKTIGVGTPIFQAPEIVENKQNYSNKVDVWALACVFYEIFNQKALFDYDNHQIVQQKIQNHISDQSEVNGKISSLNCNLELQNLMRDMLHPKEDQRLNSDQVLVRLLNLKNQPKKIIPFPFQNQVNFQQIPKLNDNKVEQILPQQQQIGGRFQTQSQSQIIPQQQKVEQKQYQNQFQNPKIYFDGALEKLEIKLMEVMKNQIQIQNDEILNKFKQQEEKQKQCSLHSEENLKIFQEYQNIQEMNNKQLITNINKLNDQYTNIENKIMKLVNDKIENTNQQIQVSEQNILQKIQQQFNKEIEQLKLENQKRDQDVQKIIFQFQNELNNKQLIIKKFEQQQENNKQNKSLETQNILDNIAQKNQSFDNKFLQLEKAYSSIQQQINQIYQNQTLQIKNQMGSFLEQFTTNQCQEIEEIKQRIIIIDQQSNSFSNQQKQTEINFQQLALQQQQFYQTIKQVQNDFIQYKENQKMQIQNYLKDQKKESYQEALQIMQMNNQNIQQFKANIEKLCQIMDEQKQVSNTYIEKNKEFKEQNENQILNPFQIQNQKNASQLSKNLYLNFTSILEKFSKTHQKILYLNQQIIGFEQFIRSEKYC